MSTKRQNLTDGSSYFTIRLFSLCANDALDSKLRAYMMLVKRKAGAEMEIIRGQKTEPPRFLCFGGEKIGKSTFAAGADTPLFVQTEDGVEELGPDRLPRCATYADFKKAIAFAARSAEHATVVVDNLSGLEVLIQAHVCKQGGVASIEDFGYGKGFTKAEEVWANEVLPSFDACHDAGKVVIAIAHSQVKRVEAVDTEAYDQHGLDLHKHAAAAVCKWADVIGFATRKVNIETSDGGFNKKIHRATSPGDKRILHLVGSPAIIAGNRYGLPPTIALSWQAFVDAMANRSSKIIKAPTPSVNEAERESAEGTK